MKEKMYCLLMLHFFPFFSSNPFLFSSVHSSIGCVCVHLCLYVCESVYLFCVSVCVCLSFYPGVYQCGYVRAFMSIYDGNRHTQTLSLSHCLSLQYIYIYLPLSPCLSLSIWANSQELQTRTVLHSQSEKLWRWPITFLRQNSPRNGVEYSEGMLLA